MECLHSIDSSEFLSVIQSHEGCMAQEIHLDSLDDGWSFLTAMEGDQHRPLEEAFAS